MTRKALRQGARLRPNALIYITAAVSALLIAAYLISVFAEPDTVWFFPKKGGVSQKNALTGFAPPADNLSLAENASLVYVDATWRELEPQKDEYDFESFEAANNLVRWRAEGKRVVFRLLCDRPGGDAHIDIPDWLLEDTRGDGTHYDGAQGKGYSPNYANKFFIRRHSKLLTALGERYGADDFFFYVELGSIGHWGEWYVSLSDGAGLQLPDGDTQAVYLKQYAVAFPNSVLMTRHVFESVTGYNTGLYYNMVGDSDATADWLDELNNGDTYSSGGNSGRLTAAPDIWKRTPVGGEFAAGNDMEYYLSANLDETKRLLRDMHLTFIGPNVPVLSVQQQYPAEVAGILELAGYRLRVDNARLRYNADEREVNIDICWINDGVAPFYGDWETRLYLLSENNAIVMEMPIELELREIYGSVLTTGVKLDYDAQTDGGYYIGVAIIDPMTGMPGVELAMETDRDDRIYILGRLQGNG